MKTDDDCDRYVKDINRELTMFLPKLDTDRPRRELTSPERRQATATLRNRWLKSKGYFITEEEKQTKEKKRRDDYKRAMERLKKEYGGKTLSSADPVPKPRRADTTIWEGEVKKRDVLQRLPITKIIHVPRVEIKPRITGVNTQSRPMFYSTSAPAHGRSYPRHREDERKRTYFISREWASENVSWHRFHNTNLSDIHKISWIQ